MLPAVFAVVLSGGSGRAWHHGRQLGTAQGAVRALATSAGVSHPARSWSALRPGSCRAPVQGREEGWRLLARPGWAAARLAGSVSPSLEWGEQGTEDGGAPGTCLHSLPASLEKAAWG